ncbi:MAG: MMPL family transporter [Agathobacter sp.]|nr:MMPL family transporter [Agathobacter sp.]
MQKIANFLVKQRRFVLLFMVVLAIVSALFIPKVEIITDMTKYLPDSSSMKQGLDIMEEEFADLSMSNTIRVMFSDLTEAEKELLLDQLGEIEYVDSVSYEADSEDYNKDNYTLFTLNISYDYDTPEMDSVEAAVKKDFTDYKMVYKVDNPVVTDIPLWVIAVAMVIMLTIMVVMGSSWIEPLIFLTSIGVAVLLNMGTNVFLGSVSSSTFSIGSLLQMILSIDYSIILMERYRQELCEDGDRPNAMARAINASFASVASSAITTVVGLLVLCLMSFKIGADMGIVLAKGVFISLICSFTVLPSLILVFDKWIHKTSKKVPHIPMAFMGRFSFKAKYVQTILFVVMFVVLFFSKSGANIVYTMSLASEVDDVFPKDNQIVLLYDNKDEEAITELASKWEKQDGVDEVMAYGTTLGKPYTVSQLVNEIRTMDVDMGEMEMDEDTLGILYYDYYANGNLPTMTVTDFINFLVDDVMTNEMFASEIDASMTENIDTMKKLADAQQLTKSMSISAMADFFGMSSSEVKQLYMLYFAKNGGVDTGAMTVPVFADFLVNEVANNPDYAAMFPAEMKGQLQMILTFTNKDTIQAPLNYQQAAAMLGMDEESAKMLYITYMAQQESYDPGKMELGTFVNFIVNDLAKNPVFADQFDEESLAQMESLVALTDKETITAQMDAAHLAAAFSMDEESVFGIMQMSGNTTGTMSMVEFVNVLMTPELSANFDENTLAQLGMMQTVMNATVNGDAFNFVEMAELLGMDAGQTKLLFTFYASGSEVDGWTASIKEMIDFIVLNPSMVGADQTAQLGLLQTIMNATLSDSVYGADDMAALFGMGQQDARTMYLFYISEHGDTSGWRVSAQKFISFIVSDVLADESMAGAFDAESAKQLKGTKKMIDAVVSGKLYSAEELTQIMQEMSDDMDAGAMELMYLFYGSKKEGNPEWTMTMEQLFTYLSEDLANDERFTDVLGADFKTQIADAQEQMDEATEMLVGKNHSLMMINATLPEEGAETTAFMQLLENDCQTELTGKVYMVGNTPMAFEMSKTFDDEMNKITILTALAIYVVVLITYRNAMIPLILVAIIQAAVYAIMSLMGIQGTSIYYLALIIVQSILMGSAVDYGILFTSYYREKRMEIGVKDALIASYNNSIHTFMTSGLIMVVVTAIIGEFFPDPTMGEICKIISKGALTAIILIIFILPGILAVCDKLITPKTRYEQSLIEAKEEPNE